MTKHIEIMITADLPDDETGHEAVVATKAATEAVKQVLADMKLENVHSHRKLVTRREAKPAGAP